LRPRARARAKKLCITLAGYTQHNDDYDNDSDPGGVAITARTQGSAYERPRAEVEGREGFPCLPRVAGRGSLSARCASASESRSAAPRRSRVYCAGVGPFATVALMAGPTLLRYA
jgi:hypothetical protein